MNSNATMRPDTREERESGKGRKAPPSAVLSFAAPIEAGKTTVSTSVAIRRERTPCQLRRVPSGRRPRKGDGADSRDPAGALGDQLVTGDVRGFCEDVLAEQPWQPGKPLIIDGVATRRGSGLLGEILSPARGYLIYINVDRTTQTKRLKTDPLPHEKTLDELEQHPTERQVRSRLPDRAALVLDGTQDPDESARKVIDFLTSRGKDAEEDAGVGWG